jgi:hypothetical protein
VGAGSLPHAFLALLHLWASAKGRQISFSAPRPEDEGMAHFYGVVSGRGRTTSSRVGRKNTGLRTVAASWQGAVRVRLYERDGFDRAFVELTSWHGAGVSRVLYDGPVAGVALMRNQGSPDGHRFHIASMTSVRGSKTNWPQVKYERGQEDNGAPEEIRTPDPQMRSLVPSG